MILHLVSNSMKIPDWYLLNRGNSDEHFIVAYLVKDCIIGGFKENLSLDENLYPYSWIMTYVFWMHLKKKKVSDDINQIR